VIFLPCLLGLAHPGANQQATASSQNPLEPLQRCIVGAGVFPTLFREIIMTKLYVGNLPLTATEDAVRNLFAPHGTVEKVSLINDRDTSRPRGFGFLEMSSADASRAMQALNGKDFDGRALRINEAQDKPSSAGGNARY
jgi:RNA recognition motif-containing protein